MPPLDNPAPRSKLDVLYQEVLGDVVSAIERIEAVHKELPQSTLELQAALSQLREQVEVVTERAALAAAETSKADIRREAAAAAKAALAESVGDEARDILNLLGQTSERLTKAMEQVQAQAVSNVKREGVKTLLTIGFTAFMTAGFMFLILRLGNAVAPPLTELQRDALSTGRSLQMVWPELTPQEQDRLGRLLRKAK